MVKTAPIVTGDVVLQSTGNVGIASVTGIDPLGDEPLMNYLVNTRHPTWRQVSIMWWSAKAWRNAWGLNAGIVSVSWCRMCRS